MVETLINPWTKSDFVINFYYMLFYLQLLFNVNIHRTKINSMFSALKHSNLLALSSYSYVYNMHFLLYIILV